MNRAERIAWLTETDPDRLALLWERADTIRRESVGAAVHLRGLIEFSNRCWRTCTYCGIRRGRHGLRRYRMTPGEILQCADQAVALGFGTVVLQSGEDPSMPATWLADVIAQIKGRTELAVTLSVGQRDPADYALWREAGADRYLLRFETSNPQIYRRLHGTAGGGLEGRLATLAVLAELGYEVGSGMLVGLPGQSVDDLADDLEMLDRLELHMIGIGPYIPHPETPLGQIGAQARPGRTGPADLLGSKMVALTRIACPLTNIPATTALTTIAPESGRQHGLERGANVIMPNVTPPQYQKQYEIYPGKTEWNNQPVAQTVADLHQALADLHRTVGQGRGDAPAYRLSPVNEVVQCNQQ